MDSYFRLHPEDESPERLLDAAAQRAEPWGGGEDGRCDKCEGGGRVTYECESCKEGADSDCEVCGGDVRYEGRCPACRGTGEVDDEPRDGVSVFADPDGLYRYMIKRDGDLKGSVLVKLEGEPTGDEDFDADEGAVLVRPRRILGTEPVDWERVDRLRDEVC